ncbi:MAG: condensation domain-containing protein [Thermoanaerobaculia bacterium]
MTSMTAGERIAALSPSRRALLELLLIEEVAAGSRTAAVPVSSRERERTAPLAFGQQRLWLQERLEPGSAAYNTASALRLRGAVDPALLRRCFAEISRRHESLRTTFSESGGVPVQTVGPPAPVELPVVDLAGLPVERRDAELRRVAEGEFLRPFDLARGPLHRARLVRLELDEYALLIAMHHIVSDAWSMGVLTRELAAIHAAFAAGRPSPLPELPLQYADFARWQQEWMAGPALEEQLAYWRGRLAGAPEVLEVPPDRPRPAARRFRGGLLTARLPREVADPFRELCSQRGVTLFMALLAIFEVLLHARTGESDLVVGVDVAARNPPETEALIGFFVNQLVLRVDAGGDPSFAELLERVREASLGAFAHQDLPFGRLVEELAPRRTLARNPLFQVMFGLYNVPQGELDLGGVAVIPLEIEGGASVFDLSLYAAESGEELLLMLRHDADLYEPATAGRLLEDFEILARRAVAAPDERLSALVEHLAAERRRRREAGREGLEKARLKTLKTVRRRAVAAPDEPDEKDS